MPPRKRAEEPVEVEPEAVEPEADPVVAAPARPTHASELCEECGQYPLGEDVTAFACEHGSWVLS